jgi:hypothetical protein
MKNDPESAASASASKTDCCYAKPTKEAIRAWLHRVIASRRPPPDIQEIKGELWYVLRSKGREDDL